VIRVADNLLTNYRSLSNKDRRTLLDLMRRENFFGSDGEPGPQGPPGEAGATGATGAQGGPGLVNDGRLVWISDTELQWDGYWISTYNGSAWRTCIPSATPSLANTDLDLDNNALTYDYNYDVYAEDSSDTAWNWQLKKWTNDTTRSVTPQKFEGQLVYDLTAGGKKRRFLGTIRLRNASGTAKFTDSTTQAFISNYYNRELVTIAATANASGATCTSNTYVLWTNWTSPGIGIVSCWGSAFSFMAFGAFAATNDASGYRLMCAIGVDGTVGGTTGQTGSGNSVTVLAREPIYAVSIAPGYHYLDMYCQRLDGANGSPTHFLCSIQATIWR